MGQARTVLDKKLPVPDRLSCAADVMRMVYLSKKKTVMVFFYWQLRTLRLLYLCFFPKACVNEGNECIDCFYFVGAVSREYHAGSFGKAECYDGQYGFGIARFRVAFFLNTNIRAVFFSRFNKFRGRSSMKAGFVYDGRFSCVHILPILNTVSFCRLLRLEDLSHICQVVNHLAVQPADFPLFLRFKLYGLGMNNFQLNAFC